MKIKHTIIAILLVFSSVLSTTEANEYVIAMKVRYLKAFTTYVEWPSSYKQGEFIVGVLNNTEIANALTVKLKGRKIGVQDYKIVNYTNPSSIGKCHLLYIPSDESSSLKTVLGKLKRSSTLVVTDQDGLIEKGPSINLVMDGPKQKFELNKITMGRYSLTVSAQLEPMAKTVIK